MANKYFMCTEGIIWTLYPNGESNSYFTLQINDRDVYVLDRHGLIEHRFTVWDSLLELAANSHVGTEEENTVSLDTLRSDLMFQLQTPDDLDWNHLLETTAEALVLADKIDLNKRGAYG